MAIYAQKKLAAISAVYENGDQVIAKDVFF